MELTAYRRLVVGTALGLACISQAAWGQNHNMRVRVYNESSQRVYSIYTSTEWSDNWGNRDLLGSKILEPGYNIWINFNTADAEGQCMQEIKAEGPGRTYWRKKINVCTQGEWRLTD